MLRYLDGDGQRECLRRNDGLDRGDDIVCLAVQECLTSAITEREDLLERHSRDPLLKGKGEKRE